MTDDVTDWREMREFSAVDLTKSFVLSWGTESESCPDHAFYEKPRPSEKACFRPAFLEFPFCSGIKSGADEGYSQPVSEVAEALMHGAIDGLRRVGEGHYEITGGFGQVEINAERPILRLKGQMV